MIDDADLQSIRAEAATFLVQTAVIRRRTTASDGRGGRTEDWYDLATVACRLDYPAGGEAETADRYRQRTTGRLKVAYDTDLRDTDRIILDPTPGDTAKDLEQKTYEVVYVQRTPFDAYRQADVVRE